MVEWTKQNMRNYKAKDVDSYIASASREARPTLRAIRRIITSTIPKVEERISWGVPFYRYQGLLGGFAVYKKHASFGLAFALQGEVRKMLEKRGYKTGSKTVQIRFDQKVPTTAIRRILKAQARKNVAKRRAIRT